MESVAILQAVFQEPRPVRNLGDLVSGDNFYLEGMPDKKAIVLYGTFCQVTVLECTTSQRTFNADGQMVGFTITPKPVGWSPATRVIKTGHVDPNDLGMPTEYKKELPMNKAILVRWNHQVTNLRKALEVKDTTAADHARERLTVIGGEAKEQKTELFRPVDIGNDEVFKQFSALKSKGVKVKKEKEMPRAKTKSKAKTKVRAKSGTKKAKTQGLSDCHCGCGKKVSGRFKQGHDSSYRSKILQVERGQMNETALPALMRKSLNFRPAGKGKFKCTNSVLAH